MFLKQINLIGVSNLLLILFPVALSLSKAAIELIILFLVVAFIVKSVKDNKSEWVKSNYTKLFFLISAWLIFVSFFAEVSVYNSFKRSLLWIRHPMIFLAITFCFLKTLEQKKVFLIGVTSFLGLLVLDCYYQYFSGFSILGNPGFGGRLTSVLDRPNIGSFLLRISLPILALNFYLFSKDNDNSGLYKKINVLLFFGVLPVILLTGERTTSVLLLLILSLLFVMLFVSLKDKRKHILLAAFAVFFLLVLIVFMDPFISNRVAMLLKDVSSFSVSLYASLFYAAYYLWFTKGMFLGVGLKNFRETCPELLDQNIIIYCDLHPHNFYLEWLSETGLIGFCLFVFVAFVFMKKSIVLCYKLIKTNNINLLMAAFFCLSTFTVNFFPFAATMSFFSNWNAALVWFSLAIAFMVLHNIEKHKAVCN